MDLLYNQPLLQDRYPELDFQSLDQSIHQTVRREILSDLNQAGLLRVKVSGGDEANRSPEQRSAAILLLESKQQSY